MSKEVVRVLVEEVKEGQEKGYRVRVVPKRSRSIKFRKKRQLKKKKNRG